MAESLLSFSNVNLFGHKLLELQIVDPTSAVGSITLAVTVAADQRLMQLKGNFPVNGVNLVAGNTVLVWKQASSDRNEVYTVGAANADWVILPTAEGSFVQPGGGAKYAGKKFIRLSDGFEYLGDRRLGTANRKGANHQLEDQLKDGSFARIYGFSYEGIYFDLPRPLLFLVHGNGEPVSDDTGGFRSPSRSPASTSLTGVGASDFDFADGLRVWSYDKADYTVRMEVETGMFEDVLLNAMLGGGSDGLDARGMNARGMNARGMNARGMNARGMNARGMNARGSGSD